MTNIIEVGRDESRCVGMSRTAASTGSGSKARRMALSRASLASVGAADPGTAGLRSKRRVTRDVTPGDVPLPSRAESAHDDR
jgi:hypothetical protein